MKTIELHITETGRSNTKEDPSIFNEDHMSFKTIDEMKSFLMDRYGKIPKGKNKVFVDGNDGNPVCIGFLHSFWNQDWSHASKKWYQTDWITFYEQETSKKYFKL
jgi:hypothetical protein